MRRLPASLAPVAFFAVLAAAMFFPVFAGGRFFTIDFHLTFEPLRGILGEALLGRGVAWNPWLANGTPLLANPLYAALYPPNLLFVFVKPAAGLTWLALLHVALGAAGAFELARELGSTRRGAAVAGLIFGFNGAALSAISYCNLASNVAWLPWTLLAAERILTRGGSAVRVAGFGLCVAMLLVLGEPMIIVAAVVGIALFGLESWVRAQPGARSRPAAGLILGGCLGVGLASPLLWEAFRYLPVSVRAAGFTPEGTTVWSLHPLLLVNLFLPNAFGDAGGWGAHRFWASALFPEKGAPLFIGSYAGASALALVLAGVGCNRRRRFVLLAWFALLLALALGRFGPIYPLLQDFSWFSAVRYPMKWLLPAMLPMALFGAWAVDGLTALARPRVKPVIASILAVFGLVAAAAVAAGPPFDAWIGRVAAPGAAERLGEYRTVFLAAGLRACIPLAASLLALLALRRVGTRNATLLLVAVLGVDLAWANRGLAPLVPASFFDLPPAARSIRSDTLHQRVFVDAVPDDLRMLRPLRTHAELARWQRELLAGYTAASYELPLALNVNTEGFGPLRYAALCVLVRAAPVRERLMILGAAGASHVVTFEELRSPYAEPLAVHDGATSRPQRVYRNRLVLPRARIVAGLLHYDGDPGYIAAVRNGPDDLFARVGLTEDRVPGPPPSLDGPLPRVGTARIVEERNTRLRLVTRGEGGYLIVSDTWAPGWNATVDGQPTPVLRADYTFRALRVPAGEHEVEMTYRAW